jgi:hypothetical protein
MPKRVERANRGAKRFGARDVGAVTSNSAPLTHCRDNNLLNVVSIFTNILLVPLMCIMVTTHNEMCMCRTLSHKTAHIRGYYKWQKYYNEVSCILNRLAGTSSMVVEALGRCFYD